MKRINRGRAVQGESKTKTRSQSVVDQRRNLNSANPDRSRKIPSAPRAVCLSLPSYSTFSLTSSLPHFSSSHSSTSPSHLLSSLHLTILPPLLAFLLLFLFPPPLCLSFALHLPPFPHFDTLVSLIELLCLFPPFRFHNALVHLHHSIRRRPPPIIPVENGDSILREIDPSSPFSSPNSFRINFRHFPPAPSPLFPLDLLKGSETRSILVSCTRSPILRARPVMAGSG